MARRGRWVRLAAVVAAVAVAALSLAAPAWHELGLARARRAALRYGTDVAWHVVCESALSPIRAALDPEVQAASASGGLISDHDLYMLRRAAERHVLRDDALARAAAEGRLPVRYSYLDGFDVDVLALRHTLEGDLPGLGIPDLGSTSSWPVAPVLLGWRASPDLRAVANQLVADGPALSVHTAGQVLTADVHVRGVRYALACVVEDPATRAAEVAAVERRAAEVAAHAEALAGDDDYAYVRAAFDELSRTVSYATDAGASPHYNDVYGALVEGSARCYGLSGALKMVLDLRGIPNYLANGIKPGGRHTWNVVWLQGSWRVCDLTLMVDAREGDAGLSADPEHRGMYACLELQRNFYVEHSYVPDDDARILQLVYEGMFKGE